MVTKSSTCQTSAIMDSRVVVDDFRRYKFNQRCPGYSLSALIQTVRLLPISSANCEGGFSCMNLNRTSVRKLTLCQCCCSSTLMDHCQILSINPIMWKSGSKLVATLHRMHQTGKKAEKQKPVSEWTRLLS